MATSVSVVLHRTVPLLMLLISENMSMVHCTCSGGATQRLSQVTVKVACYMKPPFPSRYNGDGSSN